MRHRPVHRAAASDHASMRPGPIRPGDGAVKYRPPGSTRRFNEARADSPGRWRKGRTTLSQFPLASMRPGPIRPGDHPLRPGRTRPASASMRPGPIRPGDHRGPCGGTGDGPGFNEARADSPGRFLRRRHSLADEIASMRPGPIRPGDEVLRGAQPCRRDASMRPGPIRPGDRHPDRRGDGSNGRFNEARADSPGRSDRGRPYPIVLPALQ